jgi:CubicO group peptidase (beta-lactamase class C family)
MLLATGLCCAAQTTAAKDDGMGARLDAAIDSAITSHRIVGAVVVVLRDGKVVYRRAAGLADREAGTPMRENEIFRLASVSKPIVTVAALRLVDEGRLHLDDPVTTYLPDFRPKLADGSEPVITIRQLLTHTAGLSYGFLEPTNGPYHRAGVSDGLAEPGLPMPEELRRIVAAGLAYAPGTSWRYSVAIDVLGAVIERVTNKSLPDAMKALVTEPIGMSDTGFAPPERSRLATPYADGAPPVRMGDPYLLPLPDGRGISYSPGRAFDPHSFPSGGGGMNGTAEDVARLLEVVRTGGGNILKPATAHAMLINQTGSLPIIFGPGLGFGFGGALLTDPKAAKTPQSLGTWAWGGAWGHSWFVDPMSRLVVVALTNTAVEGMSGKFPTDVRDAVYGKK